MAVEKEKKLEPETLAEFEKMKMEWEQVRDQQIRMIQDKEEELERLKDELFKKAREKNVAVPTEEDLSESKKIEAPGREVLARAAGDPAVIESFEEKIAELKEANRRLSGELLELKTRNRELETTQGRFVPAKDREELRKEKEEFEVQKASFQKERQKFFQEMSRQKQRLEELNVSSVGSNDFGESE